MNNYTQNIDGKVVSTFIKKNLKDKKIGEDKETKTISYKHDCGQGLCFFFK